MTKTQTLPEPNPPSTVYRAPGVWGSGAIPPDPVALSSEHGHTERTVFEWHRDGNRRGIDAVNVEFGGSHLIAIGLSERKRRRPSINCVSVVHYQAPPTVEQLIEHLRTLTTRRGIDVRLILSTPRTVVRHFLLPPTPLRQRHAAALWQGQKLTPFSLSATEALHGMTYLPAGDRGSWATVVAVPRADAAPILEAVSRLGWIIRGTTIVGGSCPQSEATGKDSNRALVIWTRERGTFSVFHGNRLIFHYDLGPMPQGPAGLDSGVNSDTADMWQRWIESLGVVVADALDFHLNISPNAPPSQVLIYGLPREVAPMLTDWSARFPGGVIVDNPCEADCSDLPDHVQSWFCSNAGIVIPALHAGEQNIVADLTPGDLVRARQGVRRQRIARAACILSAAVCTITGVTGWQHLNSQLQRTATAREELARLSATPLAMQYESSVSRLSARRGLLARVDQPGRSAMPWMRAVFATLPPHASLTHADAQLRGNGGDSITLTIEGILSADGPAHAIAYRDWINAMERVAGNHRVVLFSERSIEWKGQKRSAFSLRLTPERTFVWPENRAQ